MADTTIPIPGTPKTLRGFDTGAGIDEYTRPVDPLTGVPYLQGLTDAQLRATPVPVSGTVTTTGLTDAQLRATPVPVSGTVAVSNFPATQPVSGTVTSNQGTSPWVVSGTVASTQSGTWNVGRTWNLASGSDSVTAVISGTVPVSGTIAATQSGSWTVAVSGSVAVTGPLTDTQLRATPVPVSGTVSAAQSGSWTVTTGGLTDTQLRATPVPVSGTVTVTPSGTQDENLTKIAGTAVSAGSGASSAGTQRVILATDQTSIPVTGTFFQATQPVSGTVAVSNFPAAQPVSGTVAVTQSTSPWVVSGTVATTSASPTAVVAFLTAVTTAGTRVNLASNAVLGGIVQAPSTNTGLIYVGGATVSSSSYGAELQPGQSAGIAIDNTSRLWIDASVSGDKMAFFGS